MTSPTDEARRILAANDRGGYTIPTSRLYPFQWNWDAGFSALGWARFDEPRAWTEFDRLFEGQWPDGLVPHIIFHQPSADYFPGPDVWRTGHQPPTSGITQPPVAASMVRRLLEGARDHGLAEARARALYPRLLAWHRWWVEARDPEGSGLVAILHPWESGMDNSPAWDAALARVPPTANPYVRRDTAHIDGSQRPQRAEYDRFIGLVESYREVGYRPADMMRVATFKVADVALNAILLRANRDLAALAGRFGSPAEQAELDRRSAAMTAAFARLWNPARRIYQNLDLVTGERIDVATSGGFLALYAGVPDAAGAAAMAAELEDWGRAVRYLVPSAPPGQPGFEPKRYWRGPVWAVVNWMIAEGLADYALADLAERVRGDTRALIETSGFAEYFNPLDGAGLGGGVFSWTAAIYLALSEAP